MVFKKKNIEIEIEDKVVPEITFDNEMVIEDKPIIFEIKTENPEIKIDEDETLLISENEETPVITEIKEDIIETVENKINSKIIDTSKLSKEEIDELVSNLGKSDYNFYRRTGFIINRQK